MPAPTLTFRSLLWTLVAFALLIGPISAGLAIWLDYAETRRQAVQRLEATAALMEQQAVGSLMTADQVAKHVRDLVETIPLNELRLSRQLWDKIRAIAEETLPVASIGIYDADGNGVLSTTAFPVPRVNVADQPYFQAHRAGEELDVGGTIPVDDGGQRVSTLSRRLTDGGGGFKGVIVVALHTDSFRGLHQAADLGRSSALGIMRRSGGFLVCEPRNKTLLTRAFATSDLLQEHVSNRPIGVYETASSIDGIKRVVAYRASDDYPIMVGASLGIADALEPWRTHSLWTAGIAAVLTMLMGVLAALLVKTTRREARAWAALSEVNQHLAADLNDKNILFREVHHRIKNNLQTVMSLLWLQQSHAHDPATQATFQKAIDRVQSIASLHDSLYRANQADEVDLADYLSGLCQSLAKSYGAEERGITLATDLKACNVPLKQAMPIALIVSEVVTNSFRHAFADGSAGSITIALDCDAHECTITISDTGSGLPSGPSRRGSIGMALINALVQQANGRHQFESNGGAVFSMTFPRRGNGAAAAAATGFHPIKQPNCSPHSAIAPAHPASPHRKAGPAVRIVMPGLDPQR